jgi:hypothetical protein
MINNKLPFFVDGDELKLLWRMLARLQADVMIRKDGCGYVWNDEEKAALVTVMDAVLDSQMPAMTEEEKKLLALPGHGDPAS